MIIIKGLCKETSGSFTFISLSNDSDQALDNLSETYFPNWQTRRLEFGLITELVELEEGHTWLLAYRQVNKDFLFV